MQLGLLSMRAYCEFHSQYHEYVRVMLIRDDCVHLALSTSSTKKEMMNYEFEQLIQLQITLPLRVST